MALMQLATSNKTSNAHHYRLDNHKHDLQDNLFLPVDRCNIIPSDVVIKRHENHD